MTLDPLRGPVATLRAAVAGRVPSSEGRDAVYRLLAAGDRSRERNGDKRGKPNAVSDRDEYDSAFDAALRTLPERIDAAVARQLRAAELAERVVTVSRVSPAEARILAVAVPAELLGALVRELAERAEAISLDSPPHAITVAGIAVAAAEQGRPDEADRRRSDIRALARLALADAAYRGGDLIAAEGALRESARLAALGSRDPLLRAETLRVASKIRSDQSRHAEACRLAQRSVAIFHRHHEARREARGRISLAVKLFLAGRPDEALRELDRARPLIDERRDGRLLLALEFNRAFWHTDIGEPQPARRALPRLAELVARHGKAKDRVRLDWLAARAAALEGDPARAVELYRPVLDTCLELDTAYDSATVALELALLLLELGRSAEVLPLADAIAPIFRAQGVEPEAAAAVILAAESLRQGVAAHEVLRNLATQRVAPRAGR